MVVCLRGSVKGNESTSTQSYVGLAPEHSIKRFFPCRSCVNKRLVLPRDEQSPTNAIGAMILCEMRIDHEISVDICVQKQVQFYN